MCWVIFYFSVDVVFVFSIIVSDRDFECGFGYFVGGDVWVFGGGYYFSIV